MRRLHGLAGLLVAAALAAPPAKAQSPWATGRGGAVAPVPDPHPAGGATAARKPAPLRPGAGLTPASGVMPASLALPVWKRRWFPPVASLLVPGSGQLLEGHDRGLVYLVTEAWFLARALALSQQGRRERAQLQNIALDVARRGYTTTGAVGSWTYYETMSEWVQSGAYNTSTTGGFQPETDTLTFNGAMWQLARRNYFANPDSIPPDTSAAYQAALAFYRQRAFSDQYRWSWQNARLELDEYKNAITESNQGYQEATNYFGALLVNHLASMVDAFVTARLGRGAGRAVPRVQVTESPQRLWLLWEHPF